MKIGPTDAQKRERRLDWRLAEASSLGDLKFSRSDEVVWVHAEKLVSQAGDAFVEGTHPLQLLTDNNAQSPGIEKGNRVKATAPWSSRSSPPRPPIFRRSSRSQLKRLLLLRRSIERKGYKFDPQDEHATPLYYLLTGESIGEDEQAFRVVVRGGQHRVVVLISLGWRLIPLRATRSVAREINIRDCAIWPQVANGRYTKESAKSFFEQFFSGTTKGLN